ncbi:MAG: hypothetical protein Q9P01_10740 [Anaerolineae bacterium]|nr:hypothetical protein [Anaerolineae bacterium]
MISHTPLSIVVVDDLSRINAFSGASTRAIVIVLQKGKKDPLPRAVLSMAQKRQTDSRL